MNWIFTEEEEGQDMRACHCSFFLVHLLPEEVILHITPVMLNKAENHDNCNVPEQSLLLARAEQNDCTELSGSIHSYEHGSCLEYAKDYCTSKETYLDHLTASNPNEAVQLIWGGLGSLASHGLSFFADSQHLVAVWGVDGEQEEHVMLFGAIPFCHHISSQPCGTKSLRHESFEAESSAPGLLTKQALPKGQAEYRQQATMQQSLTEARPLGDAPAVSQEFKSEVKAVCSSESWMFARADSKVPETAARRLLAGVSTFEVDDDVSLYSCWFILPHIGLAHLNDAELLYGQCHASPTLKDYRVIIIPATIYAGASP